MHKEQQAGQVWPVILVQRIVHTKKGKCSRKVIRGSESSGQTIVAGSRRRPNADGSGCTASCAVVGEASGSLVPVGVGAA